MESTAEAIEEQNGILKHIQRMATTFASKPREAKSKGYVQTVLEDLEQNFRAFKDGHEQVISILRDKSLPDKDVPYLCNDVYYTCYDTYIAFKTVLLDLIFEFESPQNSTTPTGSFVTSSRNESFIAGARLPKIDLPKFSGDYLEWISYRDMFLSLVHHNNSLSKIQKYFYLKGSCVGTPLSLVNEYPAAESSYDLAWEALERRFHNERKLVEQILKKLFTIPHSNGSFHSIKELLDSTRNCLAQLKSLKIDLSTWDPILIYMTSQKLDSQTRKEWEQSLKNNTSVPPITDMLSFLETLFRALESIDDVTPASHSKFTGDKPTESRRKPMRTIRTHNATTLLNDSCPCCNKRHPLYKCFKFATLTSVQKKNILTQQGLCRNCLRAGHMQFACKLPTKCQLCGEPHHTIVHNEFSTSVSTQPGPSKSNASIDVENQSNVKSLPTSSAITDSVSTLLVSMKPTKLNPALLATVKVMIITKNKILNVKALVDQGSQVSFVSEELCQLLALPKNKTNIVVSGIGSKRAITVKKTVNLSIRSNYDQKFELNLTALVVPSVSKYLPNKILPADLPDLSKFYLADPQFLQAEKIDLLLGNDVYGELLLSGMEKFKNSFLLQETYFGWMISGSTSQTTNQVNIAANLCTLEKQLRLFWEQEEIGESIPTTKEETLCENLFLETHTRDETGRYTVHLPFKNVLHGKPLPTFSYTDYNAIKRLKQLESSFKIKPQFATQYKNFMEEYEALNHMVKLDAAKLFDPLGWLSPVTVLAKITFQELWKIKVDWEDSLPEDISRRWIKFRSTLKYLETIRIPRWLGCTATGINVELHGFSDASKMAYAAAKTKVAPLKTETIPRLELSAATLLAKLIASIKTNADLNISRIIYWTDSTIVLAWLQNCSTRLEVYVANRVAIIQRLTKVNEWSYVPSGDNPADCASRGLQPEELIQHRKWFEGPPWLKTSPETWPKYPVPKTTVILHQNNISSNSSNILQYPDLTIKFSKWIKLKNNLKIGDLVFLLNEKTVPGQWPLAKVEKLHPGQDGLTRVVTVYCNGKNIKRPISKLCLLPINDVLNQDDK